jgi:hypothetical protein
MGNVRRINVEELTLEELPEPTAIRTRSKKIFR